VPQREKEIRFSSRIRLNTDSFCEFQAMRRAIRQLRGLGTTVNEKTLNDKVYYCKANITCVGGRVKDGKCVCPRGLTVITTGPNAFACVKAPTGGTTQGSTGGTSGGSTGAPAEGQTGVHVPNFKVPPSGVLVPR
jgi:hypothetical protein